MEARPRRLTVRSSLSVVQRPRKRKLRCLGEPANSSHLSSWATSLRQTAGTASGATSARWLSKLAGAVPAALELSAGWEVIAGGTGELSTPTGTAIIFNVHVPPDRQYLSPTR